MRKSVTPKDDGAINVIKHKLKKLGFINKDLPFGGNKNDDLILNLYSVRKKGSSKTLCFAGHTDVVPVGEERKWRFNPFSAKIDKKKLYGRGASDMKGAIAAWILACEDVLKNNNLNISLALLITGDEEGLAENGTKKVVQWLKKEKIKVDHCLVGEPTNPEKIGDMIKIGRRGSLSLKLYFNGKAGHVAYPHLAKNPLNDTVEVCSKIKKISFSKKAAGFPVSNLEITSIDSQNEVSNVIPASCSVNMNIRYNTRYKEKDILDKIKFVCKKYSNNFTIEIISSNKPFYTKPDKFTQILSNSVRKVTGRKAELSTTGGTSDARFIKDLCPVVEFGAVGKTMHQTDEHILVGDLEKLKNIYKEFIISYNNFYK
tara:strand:- start:112 stop:1227 length:1116 start_codon:yes stop_codon:yes gene_type:complete